MEKKNELKMNSFINEWINDYIMKEANNISHDSNIKIKRWTTRTI